MKYQELIEMGFSRHDMEDDIEFNDTGYYGFALEMEFENLNVGISTGCFVINEKPKWEFKLYRIDSGNIVRQVMDSELNQLIERLQEISHEASRISTDVEKTVVEGE